MLIDLLEDMKRMLDVASLERRRICKEYESRKEELYARRKEVELREKEVDQGNESERKMLDNQKKQYEMAILELEMAKENIMRRAEEQNREKELILKQIIDLVAELVQTQALERMEELDMEEFVNAVKVKYGSADLEKAKELCSLWEGYFGDPSWRPYKVVMVGEEDKVVVLDANDDKLKELKNEFGEEVYEIVAKALNKSLGNISRSMHPLIESLYTSEKRAALKEGVARLLNEWKIQKGKRKRN